MSNHVHTELTIRSTDANRFIEALKLEQYHCHLNDDDTATLSFIWKYPTAANFRIPSTEPAQMSLSYLPFIGCHSQGEEFSSSRLACNGFTSDEWAEDDDGNVSVPYDLFKGIIDPTYLKQIEAFRKIYLEARQALGLHLPASA